MSRLWTDGDNLQRPQTTRTVEACTHCTFPMVWSSDRRRMWCSVYGTHNTPVHGIACICTRCVMRRAA